VLSSIDTVGPSSKQPSKLKVTAAIRFHSAWEILTCTIDFDGIALYLRNILLSVILIFYSPEICHNIHGLILMTKGQVIKRI
jgi:hypothetical protein